MLPDVDTRNPGAILEVCLAAYREITGKPDDGLLTDAFQWLQDAFAGRHPDYEPLDTKYHDLEHTLQGTLCLARLLAAWARAKGQPALDCRAVRRGLVAILLHDTGYLKPRGDHHGSGAKFTPIHVQRSAEFAARLLNREGFPAEDVDEVQNMIRCTGVNARVDALSFARPVDQAVGCALASADLLGQMAAPDYVDRLPALYAEFSEAASHPEFGTSDLIHFSGADDLIRRTPAFWSFHVRPRLDGEFRGTYRFLNQPWPDGPNHYVEAVEANIQRIRDRWPALA